MAKPQATRPTLGGIIEPGAKLDSEFWIKAATDAVRRFCEWHVAPVIRETITLNARGASVVALPTLRVVEIHSITVGGRELDPDSLSIDANGLIELPGRARFPDRTASVVVDMEHGFDQDDVPSVAKVIAAFATRGSEALGNVVQSQSAGGSSVSYFQGSEALLRSEKADLEAFRLGARP